MTIFVHASWKHLRIPLYAAVAILSFSVSSYGANEAKPTTFERVFGVPGTFDAAMVEKVISLPAGKRLAIDRDGDGKNDELWFIDNDPRHTSSRRPILVRVIDEDGDLDTTGPDQDSDLYLADWRADGVIDSVVDYYDEDNDNDVDQMGIFFGDAQQPWTDKNVVQVYWSRDVGDDNLLWYDVDWSYNQNTCQYHSHFSGDEVFYRFVLNGDAPQWHNERESPFAFYDPDNDGCSEVAVCISATKNEVHSLRYSMDADNDAFGRNTHDYEFSISAVPENNALQIGSEVIESFSIRAIPVQPVLGWQEVRDFARQANWAKACLTWDEMNANTAEQVNRDPHERWEGVINHASENFPQVGEPPGSPLNKRTEIALKPALPLRLYYDSTDRRLHLLGANNGWLDVDADLDGKVDARYVYLDTNADGIFDRRQLDLDADGTLDFDWPMQVKDTQKFEIEQPTISEFYQASLAQTLADSQTFIDAAKSVLIDLHKYHDPAEAFFLDELVNWKPETRLGLRMRSTPGGARFYLDLIRDRLFLALHKQFGSTDKWRKVEGAYQTGNYRAAATNILGLGISQSQRLPAAFQSYTRRLPLSISNANMPQRDACPITLLVSEIQKHAPDFTPNRCAVVAPERWIDWRQLAHQVDQLDESVGQEISFLADLPAGATSTYYLYYAPTADHAVDFPDKTTATVDLTPFHAEWESNRGAYRAHGGQIDALHNDKTLGLSGLTLYRAERSWPLQHPTDAGRIEFSQRVLAQGPIRSVIEIAANNIVPMRRKLTVRTRCLIYAEHQETEIRVTVAGRREHKYMLAPALVKLSRGKTFADSTTGVFGSWGWQKDALGEVAIGLILPPQAIHDVLENATERRIRCRTTENGKLHYWLLGDWSRSRQYPVAPTIDNWQRQLNDLATRLLNNPQIKIGEPETLP